MTDALTIQDAQFDPAAPIASRPVAERSRTQFGALFHAFAPGLAVGLGAFALACLILIAVNLTLIRVGADLSAGATPRALDIGMILVFNAALAAGCIGWARVSAPPDWRDALGLIHAPVDSRVLGMMVLALVAGIAWVEVLAAIVGRAQFQSATSVLVFEGGPLLRFFTALAVVVAAPVAEEMFFRGFLQGRLRGASVPCSRSASPRSPSRSCITAAISCIRSASRSCRSAAACCASGPAASGRRSCCTRSTIPSSSSRSSCAADPCGPARTALTRA